MRHRTGRQFVCFVALVLLSTAAWAGEPAGKSKAPVAKGKATAVKGTECAAENKEPAAKGKESAAKESAARSIEESAATPPATHTVKKWPWKITVDLEGVFTAQTDHEIVVKLDEWNSLVVLSAVAHGAQVRQGDVLLTLETEKIDRAIADVRTELKLSEIAIKQGEDQLQALEKSTPLDLEASQRTARIAEEDRKFLLDVERPFALKAVEFGLKMAKDMLEYEQEELHQLEKMYKADDITEETEQIVLKRARDTVERAKFMVEASQINHDQALKFMIPRVEELVKESARRKTLDWEKSKVELPLALQKQRLELEKLGVQRERADDKLKKLLGDREAMTVKSPADGVVYYGKCVRGKFSDASHLAESLRPNGALQPNQVVMTVVQPRPMFVCAAVPEEQLHYLKPGLQGMATPTGYPALRLPVTTDNVSDIPTAPGSFDARLNVQLDRKGKWLMPGMTCKVKLVPYQRTDAITVPPKAVSADELDEQKHFVYVLAKDGKPTKRPVTLGEKSSKQVEIVKGLAEGEKVLLEAPKEGK